MIRGIDKCGPHREKREKKNQGGQRDFYTWRCYVSDGERCRITFLGGWRISGLFHDSPSFRTRAAAARCWELWRQGLPRATVIDEGTVIIIRSSRLSRCFMMKQWSRSVFLKSPATRINGTFCIVSFQIAGDVAIQFSSFSKFWKKVKSRWKNFPKSR